MKVIVVEPKKAAFLMEIDSGLAPLQEAVGGLIEAIYPFDDPVALVCNEEGKLLDLEKNRALRNENGVYDIVYGTFLIVGLGEEDFCSLSQELIDKYMRMYKVPEAFVYVDGKIGVLRIPEITE